jgi:hypothetical protein
MRLLPFFHRESTALIKIYPRRVVFELPKIDVKPTQLKVMEIHGRIYVLGHLECEIASALAKHKNGVIDIAHMERPDAGNVTACDYTTCRCA